MADEHDMRRECAENFAVLLNHKNQDIAWRTGVDRKLDCLVQIPVIATRLEHLEEIVSKHLERLSQVPVIAAKVEVLEEIADRQDSRTWDFASKLASVAALVGVIILLISKYVIQ